MELDKSPQVANVLVFQDHFTKYVLAYVTPNQTAKIITKFLYGGFISIFGAPARLLSDRGTSFTSSIIQELCEILGVQRLQTMPYHPQANGLVERLHQTIICMIGKLGEDKKANMPSHLAEIAHAYNATQLAVNEYSPHYLMFGRWPRLPVDFIFPTIGSSEAPTREASARKVDTYVASVRPIEEHPEGGAGPINCRGMPTEVVLQQKGRHCEFEAWQPGTSEGRCLEGKEED